MRFLRWARTIRFYRIGGHYVAADRCGWIPGTASSRTGMLVKALQVYFRSRRGSDE